MTDFSFYELQEPTEWAEAPSLYSYSSLSTIRTCPRRWQLQNSRWGSLDRFPVRQHPAAIEGQIIHAALDLLSSSLGRWGRPPVGSPEFVTAVEQCGFWAFFDQEIAVWNKKSLS